MRKMAGALRQSRLAFRDQIGWRRKIITFRRREDQKIKTTWQVVRVFLRRRGTWQQASPMAFRLSTLVVAFLFIVTATHSWFMDDRDSTLSFQSSTHSSSPTSTPSYSRLKVGIKRQSTSNLVSLLNQEHL